MIWLGGRVLDIMWPTLGRERPVEEAPGSQLAVYPIAKTYMLFGDVYVHETLEGELYDEISRLETMVIIWNDQATAKRLTPQSLAVEC
jgi:hypothetical protein